MVVAATAKPAAVATTVTAAATRVTLARLAAYSCLLLGHMGGTTSWRTLLWPLLLPLPPQQQQVGTGATMEHLL